MNGVFMGREQTEKGGIRPQKTTETVRLNPCCPWGDAIIGEAQEGNGRESGDKTEAGLRETLKKWWKNTQEMVEKLKSWQTFPKRWRVWLALLQISLPEAHSVAVVWGRIEPSQEVAA